MEELGKEQSNVDLLLSLYTGTYVVFHAHFSRICLQITPHPYFRLAVFLMSVKLCLGPGITPIRVNLVFSCAYMTNSAIKDRYEDRL